MSGAAAPDRFAVAKAALTRIAHHVAIVGAAAGTERSCATGTAMYVSLSPAMLAIALHPSSRTARLIRESGEFSVSLLGADQQDLAAAAGRSAAGPDKFATLGIPTLDPPAGRGAPGVRDSIAVLWCRVTETRPAGDHEIHVGEVVAHVSDEGDREALLRFRRRYARLGPATSGEAPEGYPT